MKKRLMVFLLISVMTFSFAVPAMANVSVVNDPVCVGGGENTIDNELTQIYWRTFNGVLQFRVWSITHGKWLTEWTNIQ
jgi:hypothetical protein